MALLRQTLLVGRTHKIYLGIQSVDKGVLQERGYLKVRAGTFQGNFGQAGLKKNEDPSIKRRAYSEFPFIFCELV